MIIYICCQDLRENESLCQHGCLVQLCLTPRRKQTVNSTAGANLGVELLQEGLLSSWHHRVQVRLEGFELLCQKHTVVVGRRGTEKQTQCESDPQQKPTSLIWFNQDRQIHEPEPTPRVCFSKLPFRSKKMFLSDKNISNLLFAYLCNKSESETVCMILTFAADL